MNQHFVLLTCLSGKNVVTDVHFLCTFLATVKVYFSLNELTYQSKKTDKQGSPEMKSFHSINFDYIAI